MAYKRFDSSTNEFKMFREFWEIFENFGQVENTEKYWSELLNKARQFSKKYGEYGKQIMLVTYEEFERRAKEKLNEDCKHN